MDEDEGEVEMSEEVGEQEPQEPVKKNGSKKKRDSKRDSFAARHQQLFLVEFLVDTVTIDPCAVDEEVLEGQTCLSLNFLNFPSMEICEKDFDPNKEQGLDKVRFNCGKSLMFAFNENQCEHPPPLMVEITVSKKLEVDDSSCKVDIGVIKICVSELFRQIVDIAKFKPEKLPASKSIKDCFMLIGPGKRTMGEVSVYIRLSCLGQNIVTEFQCGSDLKNDPVMFKSREGKKVFQFTGSEMPDEGQANGTFKPGCCCIPSPNEQQPPSRGGQGDAGQSGPCVGGVYTKGNKVVMDIPDKSNRNQGQNVPPVRIRGPNKFGDQKRPQGNGKEDVDVCQKDTNPDQNCFILKVGDKGQIPDRGKMILEFRTPKQKILPKILPPYHEDIAVQTDNPKKGKGKKKK